MHRFAALCALLLFVSHAAAENWPTWRGVDGSGVSHETKLNLVWGDDKNIAWTFKMPGRGGATYAGFELEKNWQDLPIGQAGRVDAQEYWDRIHHFLERIIPVAKQHGVKMACHPYDPPGLPFGYQGAENWDSPSIFDAIKKYEAAYESPYNAFQLCLGTVAEGLKNPRTEIIPIVQYLADRGKICQIHMRNIRGGLGRFEEVYPDEGDLDFLAIMRVLRDSQFAGSICPDHMPRHADDARHGLDVGPERSGFIAGDQVAGCAAGRKVLFAVSRGAVAIDSHDRRMDASHRTHA